MAEVTITNLVVEQRPGTKLVEITYDVSSTTTNQVWVLLMVSNGEVEVSAPSVSGDVGEGVATGAGRLITWNMGMDWSASVASLAFSVGADDGVPPDGGDPTAVIWVVINDRWVKNIYANGNITMSDRTTGLMWPYSANLCGSKHWFDAKSFCDNLTYAGHSNWRLPYVDEDGLIRAREFEEMYSQKLLFTDLLSSSYWSGTVIPGNSHAWKMNMLGSGPYIASMRQHYGGVWPVRNF